MNKSKFPANSYIGSLELKNVSEFIENSFHMMFSGLVESGLLIRKLAGGVLGSDFMVSVSSPADNNFVININPGFFVKNINEKARIFELKQTGMTIDTANYPPGTYNISLIPSVSSYEEGTLSFQQGSDIVTITGGTFKRLRPYGYIMFGSEDSPLEEDTAFQVIEVNETTARLEKVFGYPSMNNIRWKIGARFAVNTVPAENDAKLLFEYDTCSVKIWDKTPGIILATLTIVESPPGTFTASVSDKRKDSIALFKSSYASADDVVNGIYNSITTIEEKARAARLDKIVSDITTSGVRSGGALTIQSDRYLKIAPLVAYDGLGRRIELLTEYTFDLNDLYAKGIIHQVPGSNPLYIYYKEPNNCDFAWNVAGSKSGYVYLGEVTFPASPANGYYSLTTGKIKSKVKSISLISEGRNTPSAATNLEATEWSEGEIYYDPSGKKCFYVKKNTDNKLEAVELINMETFEEKTKFTENLRFVLYPYEEGKNNWFLFSGIAAPCPIGYPFSVLEWKIGILAIAGFSEETNSKVDYMSSLGSLPKVASEANAWTYVKTKELNTTRFAENSVIGVYFRGYASTRLIELRLNEFLLDSINMETEVPLPDGGNGSPINKLYVVEVKVRYSSTIPAPPSER